MPIIAIPTGIPIKGCTFSLQSNTQFFVSPLNKSEQRTELPGARWTVTFTLVPKLRKDIAAVQAFLVKLRGGANKFYGFDPLGTTPRGTAGGTPLVNGSSQVGGSLITDGWSAGATMLAGDYFSVNSELKMVTDDCTADGTGNMTLLFQPNLRNAPADNAAITTTNATCIMRLTGDDQTSWDEDNAQRYAMTFSGVETFF